MPYYRLYFVNQQSGHIERFEEMDAADDAEAMAQAEPFEGEHALELWCERRKVARIEPNDPLSKLTRRWKEHRAGRGERLSA